MRDEARGLKARCAVRVAMLSCLRTLRDLWMKVVSLSSVVMENLVGLMAYRANAQKELIMKKIIQVKVFLSLSTPAWNVPLGPV
jgi:hypothetical protein